jgi:hypothetical protein
VKSDDSENSDPAQSVDVGTIGSRTGGPGSALRLVVGGDVIGVGGSWSVHQSLQLRDLERLRGLLQKCTN